MQADKNVHYDNQFQPTEHKKESVYGEVRGKIGRETYRKFPEKILLQSCKVSKVEIQISADKTFPFFLISRTLKADVRYLSITFKFFSSYHDDRKLNIHQH
jgi:hypothetical protein